MVMAHEHDREHDAEKIQHSPFKENMAKNCPKFYSRFKIFASRPTQKYLNLIVLIVLVGFKSEVITKKLLLKSIWNMAKPRASIHYKLIRFFLCHSAIFQRMRVKDSLRTTSDVWVEIIYTII